VEIEALHSFFPHELGFSDLGFLNGEGENTSQSLWLRSVGRKKPPLKDHLATFHAISTEELAGACHNFSPELLYRDRVFGHVYRCHLDMITNVDITGITSKPPKV